MLRRILPIVDVLVLPLLYPAAWLLKLVRRVGLGRLPRSRGALLRVGVFPIADHYYEPQFDYRSSRRSFAVDRALPGIDWNEAGQLARLDTFGFARELEGLSREKTNDLSFHFANGAFESGDAEYWYQTIRCVKPKRIIEVGSGHSTRIARLAIERNAADDPTYVCEHICIEPYEHPWLERTGVKLVRKKIEDVGLGLFTSLAANDILFIDSSHVIRPQGDVVFEYLEVLPTLCKGVIVHVHDIFSPKDYLQGWLEEDVRFWNEQYLLEAFLSHNADWKVIGALNYLRHHHYDRLKAVAPFLSPDREPGSFYIQKIS